MKLLALHTHDCVKDSLRVWFSFSNASGFNWVFEASLNSSSPVWPFMSTSWHFCFLSNWLFLLQMISWSRRMAWSSSTHSRTRRTPRLLTKRTLGSCHLTSTLNILTSWQLDSTMEMLLFIMSLKTKQLRFTSALPRLENTPTQSGRQDYFSTTYLISYGCYFD